MRRIEIGCVDAQPFICHALRARFATKRFRSLLPRERRRKNRPLNSAAQLLWFENPRKIRGKRKGVSRLLLTPFLLMHGGHCCPELFTDPHAGRLRRGSSSSHTASSSIAARAYSLSRTDVLRSFPALLSLPPRRSGPVYFGSLSFRRSSGDLRSSPALRSSFAIIPPSSCTNENHAELSAGEMLPSQLALGPRYKRTINLS
jgi:hypothetical protein